jgi:glycerate kinase
MQDCCPVRVLICPDSFAGTLTAAEAAEAIAVGWRRSAPDDDLLLLPLSDGGPGFLDSVRAARGGRPRVLEVTGPTGAPVQAAYLLDPEGTAWIESASAAGLHLVPADRRDPTTTTSLGVGQLVGAACAAGASRVVVGVGGTGTCDGGAGLLAGLGALAEPGGGLIGGGGALADLTSLDLTAALDLVSGRALQVATDVDVPLLGPRGAAHGFAAQKGATPEQVEMLEEALRRWAHLLGRTQDGRSPAVALGAGAGGGMGAALIRLGARRVPGIATVLAAVGIETAMDQVDLVITGEGAFDWQSLRGKVVAGVASAALARAVPVLVLAGRVEVSRREWIRAGVAAAFAAAPEPGEDPADGVARAAERAAGTWGRVG